MRSSALLILCVRLLSCTAGGQKLTTSYDLQLSCTDGKLLEVVDAQSTPYLNTSSSLTQTNMTLCDYTTYMLFKRGCDGKSSCDIAVNDISAKCLDRDKLRIQYFCRPSPPSFSPRFRRLSGGENTTRNDSQLSGLSGGGNTTRNDSQLYTGANVKMSPGQTDCPCDVPEQEKTMEIALTIVVSVLVVTNLIQIGCFVHVIKVKKQKQAAAAQTQASSAEHGLNLSRATTARRLPSHYADRLTTVPMQHFTTGIIAKKTRSKGKAMGSKPQAAQHRFDMLIATSGGSIIAQDFQAQKMRQDQWIDPAEWKN